MKRNKYILSVMAAAGLMAVSCTDFDDYNESYTAGTADSKQTLWENIQTRENLSQFADLLKKTGFDKNLGRSQFYTVWAPVNGSFDAEYQKYQSADSATIVQRFLKSHVAYYNHMATGKLAESVQTLNEKSFSFTGEGTYTYDGMPLEEMNLPNVNGILHTIKGSAEFLPSIYEYMQDLQDDSVWNYFKKAQSEELNLSKSIEGPVVDGVQTYLDSVMDVRNYLTDQLRAYVARDDSSYTMLKLSNKGYEDFYKKVKGYYKYGDKVAFTDFTQDKDPVVTYPEKKEEQSSYTADAVKYLSDSLARFIVAEHFFFNNRAASGGKGYNRWIDGQHGQFFVEDTIRTTVGVNMTNGPEILKYVKDTVRVSNGRVWTLDTLAVHPWDSWSGRIAVLPTMSGYRAKVAATTPVSVRVTSAEIDSSKVDPDLKGQYPSVSYLDCLVTGEKQAPELTLLVDDLLSTDYNVYVVTVPANIKNKSSELPKWYRFEASFSQSSADGTKMEKTTFKPTNKMKVIDGQGNDFIADSMRVDTIFLGEVKMNLAYRGMPLVNKRKVYPNFYIRSKRNTVINRDIRDLNKQVIGKEYDLFDNRLRIASVLFIPKECPLQPKAYKDSQD